MSYNVQSRWALNTTLLNACLPVLSFSDFYVFHIKLGCSLVLTIRWLGLSHCGKQCPETQMRNEKTQSIKVTSALERSLGFPRWANNLNEARIPDPTTPALASPGDELLSSGRFFQHFSLNSHRLGRQHNHNSLPWIFFWSFHSRFKLHPGSRFSDYQIFFFLLKPGRFFPLFNKNLVQEQATYSGLRRMIVLLLWLTLSTIWLGIISPTRQSRVWMQHLQKFSRNLWPCHL